MTFRSIALAACAAAWLAAPSARADGAVSLPGQTITTAFEETIPTVPGKKLVGVVVRYAPGGTTPAHHHAPSAFITAYVLSGAIRSQVDDGPVKVFHAGETWTEQPGAHHRVSENASATEPASLLAIFVVDAKEETLTTIDPK